MCLRKQGVTVQFLIWYKENPIIPDSYKFYSMHPFLPIAIVANVDAPKNSILMSEFW